MTFFRQTCRALLPVAVLFLSACNTINTGVEYESISARQAALSAMDVWRANGRIALSSDDEGFTAAIDWRQNKLDFNAILTVVLGQKALEISQQANRAVLQARGRASVTGSNAESLLQRELGIRVPLQQFNFWMRGLPGETAVPGYDKAGRLHSLRYTDELGTNWSARFVSYQDVGELELPALIDVNGKLNGDEYNIRLAIKNWNTAVADPTNVPESPKTEIKKPAIQTPAIKKPGRLAIPGA